MTTVLITGAGGQDAYYLMKKLSGLGYQIFGMVRPGDPTRYEYLKEIPFLTLVQGDLLDYQSLLAIAGGIPQPDIIINTAGLTSPAACWGTPELAIATNGIGAIRMLDIYSGSKIKFIQFSSIARFGPYGATKVLADMFLDDYRIRGFPVTSIQFAGHHSPRRSPQFFSRRVTLGVEKIRRGDRRPLELGNLDRRQDWGAAPDFMEAVLEILEKEPSTYTVATGNPVSLREFVDRAFSYADMDWREHVKEDQFPIQPTDVPVLSAPVDQRLHWQPAMTFDALVAWLVQSERDQFRG